MSDAYKCAECGAAYDYQHHAEYCERADADPRVENNLIRTGVLASRWIPKPRQKETV